MQKCTPAIASSAFNLIAFFGLKMERAIQLDYKVI